MKDLTRQSQNLRVSASLLGLTNLRDDDEEIRSMDTFIVLEYIKSAIDIILNLKFEEIENRLKESSIDNQPLVVSNTEGSPKDNGNVFSPRIARQIFSGESSP